ncbi:hypothetical protein IDSA_10120 [Pseudidiomarina salinarum]|uniref:Peptidase S9 prolyl oligopeptidase catalytic domain-containing protein n=1 Tax=Pseudidiomarina salinarum TaxID=435908 RepID=A0A094L6Q9_9GAMM|nr:prolyl oligopeptidase family serine peptidase [Pseudidiomarina salinarum]KFZ30413.1 hypothetical protein IDSA_10120 [Pseudidiomarina salinarum]RUO68561.1 hypothetical protein CWI79_10820 [Pseudidiomarina salinarum]
MKVLRLLVLTLYVAGLVSVSPIASATTKLLGQQSCFSGPFSSHEEWLSFISAKNQDEDPEKLKKFLVLMGKAFPKDKFDSFQKELDCKFFRYTVNGELVRGFIVHPKGAVATETIVYNRGGNATFGAMTFTQLFKNVFDIANQGFTVIGSQYRGATVKGPESKDEFGGADVQDVLALRELFAEFKSIDPKRVGLMGWSRGSTQALLALKQGFDTPAVALLAGEYDKKKGFEFRPEMERIYQLRVPNYAEDKTKALEHRSAVVWANELPKQTAFLLIHGIEDIKVRYDSSVELYDKLRGHGFDAELMTLKDGHNLRTDWPGVVGRLSEFFKRELNAL